MAIVGRQAASTRAYFPAPLVSLDAAELSLDLYIRPTRDAQPTLYRNAGLAFAEEDRARLIEQGISFLYISNEQHSIYQKMLSNRMSSVMSDDSLSAAERREIVTGICCRLIEDAMEETSPEAVSSLFEVGDTISQLAVHEGDAAFLCLLNMSGHDFYTATHMMNVAIGCGLLARGVRPGDHEFAATMIRAGLVHDLGKADVDSSILNKEGKLSDEEFEAVKAHPMSGVRALRELGVNDPIIIEVTRDHHEHLTGTGYPRGLDQSQLGQPARIAAVVDVYDALSSARPYRAAIGWEDALRMMEESRGTQFDPDILDMWKRIVTVAAEKHSDELPSPTAEVRSIDEVMPSDGASRCAITAMKRELGIISKFTGHEQRMSTRYSCNIRAAITPLEDGQEAKHALECRLMDISKTGIRFACHTRVAGGRHFRVRASLGSGKRLDALARVVRPSVQPNPDGLWEHGCIFEKPSQDAKAA